MPMTLPASGLAASLGGLVKKKVDPTRLAAEVKTALGINLTPASATATVHGHISTISKRAGAPFGYANNGSAVNVCPMCADTVSAAVAHDCCEVVLYEAGEAANGEHRSTLAAHGLSVAQKNALLALLQAHVG